jgi:hypothetical protein
MNPDRSNNYKPKYKCVFSTSEIKMGVEDYDVWTARTQSDMFLEELHPQIVVKLHDDFETPPAAKLGDYLAFQVRTCFGSAQPFPLVTELLRATNREIIPSLIARAQKADSTYRPRNLLNYFTLAVEPTLDLNGVVKLLSSLPSVETAYINFRGEDPEVQPGNDPKFGQQGYHKAAPDGVGSEMVWPRNDGTGIKGADGTGVSLIDMELGWTFNHEDLANLGIGSPIYGNIVNGSRVHGTSVLGVIAATDNDKGCVGITPNLASVQVVSYAANHFTDRPNALAAAICKLKYGDILLIEAQVTGSIPAPIEVLMCEFDMIRMATAAGIIVIEAAGNRSHSSGGSNLDLYKDSSGRFILNPASPNFRDSGAILVGAATSHSPHTRFSASNYGSRVNCFAWGENVVTCLTDASGSTNCYREDFSHTSAASAIIAGVAASVQGMAEQNLLYRLSPSQMRTILSDRTIGTLAAGDMAAGGKNVELIGVMPNLHAIGHEVLNLGPAPYFRQSIADDGSLPRRAIFATPDIILSSMNSSDPQSQFGEGSGSENADVWSEELAIGQNNFLYLRASNRGGASTGGASLGTVFLSPLSTLLMPDYWQSIGSARFPAIPNGNLLIVSEAMTLAPSQTPTDSAYSVIALLSTLGDPPPTPPFFRTWDDYLRFITGNRKLGVRNLNAVEYNPAKTEEYPDKREYIALPFLAPGPPDIGRLMQLEIEAGLPAGSKAWIEAPPFLADSLSTRRNVGSVVWLAVNPFGKTTLPESLFLPNSRAALRLLIHIPHESYKARYNVFVRHLYKNEEVGRVSWRITLREGALAGKSIEMDNI